jgi:hypothetical protein
MLSLGPKLKLWLLIRRGLAEAEVKLLLKLKLKFELRLGLKLRSTLRNLCNLKIFP